MASLTTANVAQQLENKFSYKNAQVMMQYMSTYNCESQIVAEATGSLDSTGTKMAVLNGQPIYLASGTADLTLTSPEDSLTAWAVDVTATLGMIRTNGGKRWRCILAHTGKDGSDSDYINNEPGASDNWEHYWEEAPHGAVSVNTESMTLSKDQWFLVTQSAGALMQMWYAGDEAATGYAECKVPQYDPKMYIPIAFIHIANTTTAHVFGTTAMSTPTVVTLQITGPIFPHSDYWDAN